MFSKKLLFVVSLLIVIPNVDMNFMDAAWAGTGDCSYCHNPDGGPIEETFTYGIRPSGTTNWFWSSGGWVSPVSQGYYDPAAYPYMESVSECAQEDMACIFSETNCYAPIDIRRSYASQPAMVGFATPGARYDVRYPGPPGTHWETWEIQYIILGQAFVGSLGGCHPD